ncbi:MAG: hypothetical protein JRF69_13295 [Deltaproteobacteria bacterium]|nr:hypothetical protein [Deltaproteobacteria bacterium]
MLSFRALRLRFLLRQDFIGQAGEAEGFKITEKECRGGLYALPRAGVNPPEADKPRPYIVISSHPHIVISSDLSAGASAQAEARNPIRANCQKGRISPFRLRPARGTSTDKSVEMTKNIEIREEH